MKRIAKKVTLKEDTLNDINSNNINTNLFIERINDYLERANVLINNKMDDMTPEELYVSLREVFDIYFEPHDYLRVLSLKNKKHYSNFVNIKTNMYDEYGYNVSYLCAKTHKAECENNDTLSVDQLRKLTNSEELIALRPKFEKVDRKGKHEKYESFIYDYINVNDGFIENDSELYPYAALLLKKKTVVKYVLYDLKLYVDEVLHQIREITKLSFVKDDDLIALIGKKYKRAYDKATNDNVLVKNGKISVRYHRKSKSKKYNMQSR